LRWRKPFKSFWFIQECQQSSIMSLLMLEETDILDAFQAFERRCHSVPWNTPLPDLLDILRKVDVEKQTLRVQRDLHLQWNRGSLIDRQRVVNTIGKIVNDFSDGGPTFALITPCTIAAMLWEERQGSSSVLKPCRHPDGFDCHFCGMPQRGQASAVREAAFNLFCEQTFGRGLSKIIVHTRLDLDYVSIASKWHLECDVIRTSSISRDNPFNFPAFKEFRRVVEYPVLHYIDLQLCPMDVGPGENDDVGTALSFIKSLETFDGAVFAFCGTRNGEAGFSCGSSEGEVLGLLKFLQRYKGMAVSPGPAAIGSPKGTFQRQRGLYGNLKLFEGAEDLYGMIDRFYQSFYLREVVDSNVFEIFHRSPILLSVLNGFFHALSMSCLADDNSPNYGDMACCGVLTPADFFSVVYRSLRVSDTGAYDRRIICKEGGALAQLGLPRPTPRCLFCGGNHDEVLEEEFGEPYWVCPFSSHVNFRVEIARARLEAQISPLAMRPKKACVARLYPKAVRVKMDE